LGPRVSYQNRAAGLEPLLEFRRQGVIDAAEPGRRGGEDPCVLRKRQQQLALRYRWLRQRTGPHDSEEGTGDRRQQLRAEREVLGRDLVEVRPTWGVGVDTA